MAGSGRPPAAQKKILQSLRPPLPFAASSRSPFAAPNDYHRFPAGGAAAAAASGSGGIGAGGAGGGGGDIEEGLVIRTPVSARFSIYSVSVWRAGVFGARELTKLLWWFELSW